MTLAASGTAVARRAFTVEDSVNWTTIVSLGTPWSPSVASISPDGRFAAFRLASTEIQSNTIVDRLVIYSTLETLAFLEHGGAPPAPRELAVVRAGSELQRLQGVEWLSATELGYIAPDARGVPQAFVASVSTNRPSQLTWSATPVTAFARSDSGVLFFAYDPSPSQPPIAPAQNLALYQLLFPGAVEDQPVSLWLQRRPRSPPRLYSQTTGYRPTRDLQGIWPSPNGRRAIILTPAVNAPSSWSSYVGTRDEARYAPERRISDARSPALAFRHRYSLIDLDTGALSAALDAPHGNMADPYTPSRAFWMDARRIILTNTFLPLSEAPADHRIRYTNEPAIAEVDLSSGRSTPILWQSVLSDAQRLSGGRLAFLIDAIGWNGSTRELSVTLRRRNPQQELIRETMNYRLESGAWSDAGTLPSASAACCDFSVHQSINERPTLHVSSSSRDAVLLDPNTFANGLDLGRAEAISWRDDRNGIFWTGGLVYPVGYQPGRSYPLIVQSHGFRPDEFLLDGPSSPVGGSTAMAAQVFANAGFLVLQVEDNPRTLTNDSREGALVSDGIAAAVEHLTETSLADRERVGFIGFSRTGWHALYLLERHPRMFAAVSFSDSVQAGFLETNILSTNQPRDVATNLLAMSGVSRDERYAGIIQRHPLYHLQTPVPLRIEVNNRPALLPIWETYSVLRNRNWPVDLIYFAEGSHVQTRPAERLASQGGTVDWFRFWLQGYEDPDPRKSGQYDRWRELRDIVCQTERPDHAACPQ